MIAGRYTLEREVGRGGMGAVWLGRDEVLGRQVALKRVGLAPGVTTPDLARAEREARLAARLNHPHVVAVYDLVIEGPDNTEQWLVMEYVEGSTLAELLRRDGAMTPDRAAAFLGQAADALAAAHAAGIVHRDVKPSNILVAPDGQVKLSDFGIARAEADASLTQTGLVTGSPAYLSPEVASGQQATDASDVWSLGATLFHALAGHPPYEVGDNLLGALYRIVHEDPPRLPEAGWLAPLLLATMCREPADRWSMARVRDVLVAGPSTPVLAGVPAAAPAPAADPSPTRVLSRELPPVPPAYPPAPAAPPPATPSPGGRRRDRSGMLPVLAAVAAVVAIAVIGWLAYTAGTDGQRDGTAATPGTGQGSSGGSQSPSGTGAPAGVTADGLESFIEDYLATVTADPKSAWGLLTPDFQAASGGFGQYNSFWKSIETADVLSAQPDPAHRRISYTVEYLRRDGSKATDDVTLLLEGTDGDYLIAAEP
ncbi:MULTISPECIES: serine/threonine-protein kinase [unclassified Nocardioides]|uniref:serine/threonine-protein kinase n=1 Tax=unclassified Nocardioides TaxID=2615069 RepID=UPI0000EB62B2|nr:MULTISPECIES: serine/threonine-protein kinase [unclassified Nocardioides]ABL81488.1 protein kinase [Nocardioides sp. JS614]